MSLHHTNACDITTWYDTNSLRIFNPLTGEFVAFEAVVLPYLSERKTVDVI